MSLPPGALNVVLPFNPCDIAVTSSFIVRNSDVLTGGQYLTLSTSFQYAPITYYNTHRRT